MHTVGGEVFILEQGETLIMPKDVPHAVFGEERFKMQLIVSFLFPYILQGFPIWMDADRIPGVSQIV